MVVAIEGEWRKNKVKCQVVKGMASEVSIKGMSSVKSNNSWQGSILP